MLAAAKIWHGPATLKDSMASHGDATDANAKTGASGPQFAKAASLRDHTCLFSVDGVPHTRFGFSE